jgi:hypothetical protein
VYWLIPSNHAFMRAFRSAVVFAGMDAMRFSKFCSYANSEENAVATFDSDAFTPVE